MDLFYKIALNNVNTEQCKSYVFINSKMFSLCTSHHQEMGSPISRNLPACSQNRPIFWRSDWMHTWADKTDGCCFIKFQMVKFISIMQSIYCNFVPMRQGPRISKLGEFGLVRKFFSCAVVSKMYFLIPSWSKCVSCSVLPFHN